MEDILAQIKALASDADDVGRKRILQSLQELSYAIETPQDSMQRILYLYLQLAAIRVGLDLKLFDILGESRDPVTVDELATKTGAAPTLLGRLLRYLASIGTIKETAKDTFTASNITHALTIPGFQSGVYHNFNSIGPAIQALPDFLAETNYQDITDPTKTPLQKAWNTDLPLPLGADQAGEPCALQPLHDRPAHGHAGVAGRVPDRIIVQDLAATLQHAIPYEGVETMVQDFFQPQAVKGARIYYMRNIIHDYPDEKAAVILRNTAAALSPDSLILIDDMVLPNSGVHLHAAQLDLLMMTTLASMERTTEQWCALIEGKAGLKINAIYTYTSSLRDSVIECVKARVGT
ncbi:O-methyltransferase-domain-containing protein [Thermoascus aurantiacus ATCC 26904]